MNSRGYLHPVYINYNTKLYNIGFLPFQPGFPTQLPTLYLEDFHGIDIFVYEKDLIPIFDTSFLTTKYPCILSQIRIRFGMENLINTHLRLKLLP